MGCVEGIRVPFLVGHDLADLSFQSGKSFVNGRQTRSCSGTARSTQGRQIGARRPEAPQLVGKKQPNQHH